MLTAVSANQALLMPDLRTRQEDGALVIDIDLHPLFRNRSYLLEFNSNGTLSKEDGSPLPAGLPEALASFGTFAKSPGGFCVDDRGNSLILAYSICQRLPIHYPENFRNLAIRQLGARYHKAFARNSRDYMLMLDSMKKRYPILLNGRDDGKQNRRELAAILPGKDVRRMWSVRLRNVCANEITDMKDLAVSIAARYGIRLTADAIGSRTFDELRLAIEATLPQR